MVKKYDLSVTNLDSILDDIMKVFPTDSLSTPTITIIRQAVSLNISIRLAVNGICNSINSRCHSDVVNILFVFEQWINTSATLDHIINDYRSYANGCLGVDDTGNHAANILPRVMFLDKFRLEIIDMSTRQNPEFLNYELGRLLSLHLDIIKWINRERCMLDLDSKSFADRGIDLAYDIVYQIP